MAWDPSNVVMEFAIPGGMINQVKRHGLRPKKTGLPGLRGTQLRAHFNKSSDREYVMTASALF
jgi:hypothetical protein